MTEMRKNIREKEPKDPHPCKRTIKSLLFQIKEKLYFFIRRQIKLDYIYTLIERKKAKQISFIIKSNTIFKLSTTQYI
jgi:hypothetical protein